MVYSGDPSDRQGHTQTQNKGWEMIYKANGGRERKKAGVAILVSDKMDFKPTKIQKDKEGHYHGKRLNGTRRANHPKYGYLCTQYRSTQIPKASSLQPTKRLRLPYNDNGRL